jgi:hypothetical protein
VSEKATKSPDHSALATDFLLTFQRPAVHGTRRVE